MIPYNTMPSYVVTGANRGLRLEFVTQLASQPSNTIIATSRTLSPGKIGAFEALKNKSQNFHILESDTSSVESITSFAFRVMTLLGPEGKLTASPTMLESTLSPNKQVLLSPPRPYTN